MMLNLKRLPRKKRRLEVKRLRQRNDNNDRFRFKDK